MYIENSIENYGIYILVFIYIFINLYYKNLLNIAIFFIALLATINLLDTKIYSIIIAYVISILYGIYNNYHLIENFKLDITEVKEPELDTSENIKDLHSLFINIMNDRFCYNYIKHLKSKYSNIVKEDTEKYNLLKPILKELDNKLINKLIDEYDAENNNKRIVISKDNFIILGHYWWYVYKVLINQNKLGEDVDVIIIDMPLKKIVLSMNEYNKNKNI